MRNLVALWMVVALSFASGGEARGRGGQGPRYGGGHHSYSHGGHYFGGVGSSHRGGHYRNAGTGNHYGHHRL